MGTTLDINQISIDEAMSGTVARKSGLPANLPAVQPDVKPQEQK
jgi:hypothetical protein